MTLPEQQHLAELSVALEESVKLQSHYAKLLNMHDGGKRIGFDNAKAWVDRLRETGTLSAKQNYTRADDQPIDNSERLMLFMHLLGELPTDRATQMKRFCQISGLSIQEGQWALDEAVLKGFVA